MNKLALAIALALLFSAASLADQETSVEITKDDGELTIETESDGASALSPAIDVKVGSHRRAQLEQLKYERAEQSAAERERLQVIKNQRERALIDAKLRALEAEDTASDAERAAERAEMSAHEAEIARFEAEAKARQAGERNNTIQSSHIQHRTPRPVDRDVKVIERYEEVRTWRQ